MFGSIERDPRITGEQLRPSWSRKRWVYNLSVGVVLYAVAVFVFPVMLYPLVIGTGAYTLFSYLQLMTPYDKEPIPIDVLVDKNKRAVRELEQTEQQKWQRRFEEGKEYDPEI